MQKMAAITKVTVKSGIKKPQNTLRSNGLEMKKMLFPT
jgi:hypothetical protein